MTPPAAQAGGITILDAPPSDALRLDVRAIRWSCQVTHPRNVVDDYDAELRVPVGRAIRLHVWTTEPIVLARGMAVSLVGTSVTKPVNVGEPAELVFRIERPGQYAWKCPMITFEGGEGAPRRIKAISPADYDAFLQANTPDVRENMLALGRRVHEIRGAPPATRSTVRRGSVRRGAASGGPRRPPRKA